MCPDTGGNYGISYKGSIDKPLFPVTVVPSLNVEGVDQNAMTDTPRFFEHYPANIDVDGQWCYSRKGLHHLSF